MKEWEPRWIGPSKKREIKHIHHFAFKYFAVLVQQAVKSTIDNITQRTGKYQRYAKVMRPR